MPPKESISTREGAAEALRRIARLAASRNEAVARRDAELLAVHERHTPQITALTAEIAGIELLLEEWAKADRKKEFGEEQTLALSSGWLRFRRGPLKLDTYSGVEWSDVLAAVIKRKLEAYVKREPELDRRKLLADAKGEKPILTKATLKAIGVHLVQEEDFNIEPRPESEISAVTVPSA